MQAPLLIGITGKARAGKDTVAELIELERNTTKISFASPIKAAVAAIFGETPAGHKEELIEGFNFSWREAWQTLGTEWGRNLQQDLWLAIVAKEFDAIRQLDFVEPTCFVITDVRFDNEAEWIKKQDGIIVEVRRTAADKVAAHSSEEGLTLRSDFVVANDGTIDELRAKVSQVLHYAEP